MNIRYRVTLTSNERVRLEDLVSGGKVAVRKVKRAQILLAADARSTDGAIAVNVGAGTSTVYRTKQRFVEEGLEQALSESPRPGAARKLDASDESLLIAVACSKPPTGRSKWTMQLLADEMVRLTAHDSLSDETIRRRLGELPLKPWQEKMWCIPEINGEYVARMEDILQLYAEAPDPRRPVVCFDETPRQLIGEERVPIRAEPGKPKRVDYEYVRNGTANVFMFIDVNRPWRRAKVTDQRTAWISPNACESLSMFTTRRQNESGWCSTICRRIRRGRFIKHSLRRRHGESSTASSFTSRRSTRAGSTWLRSKSA
jgi:transposase